MLTPLELNPPVLPSGMTLVHFFGHEEPNSLKQLEALRVVVWRAEGFPIRPENENDTHWGDKWDAESHHFVILADGMQIAATRVSTHDSIFNLPYPEWFSDLRPEPQPPLLYVSRLVVHPEFQRRGLGDFLDAQSISLGRSLNAGAIFCDVPEYRINYLRERGFELTSEPKLGVVFPTMRFSGMVLRLRG